MVGVEEFLDLAVEEDNQAVVVVVEVPSQVRVEGVVVLACQVGVEVVEALAYLVKEVLGGEGEYRHDLVKEEALGEHRCLSDLVGVGVRVEVEVERACLHFGQRWEGQVVEGAHPVLVQEQ